MRYNTYWNPSGLSGAGVVNTEAWRTAEHPSTNAHATARGVARLYDALVQGGRFRGYELVERDALREATAEAAVGEDLVLGAAQPLRARLPADDARASDRRLAARLRALRRGRVARVLRPRRRPRLRLRHDDMGPRWQNPRNRALTEAVFASL